MTALLHPAVLSLAFLDSTQLNLFERFLTQAVSGIDSMGITAGMQNIAYVVLVIGFLWQVYQSALHGGDVRGLGTNLIKYVATAVVVMNYHAVFTTINQGFVNASNWINNASGAGNLFDNWANDLQTQFNQVGFQKLWGLVTADLPALIDALLIIVAYVLYPLVVAIFGFFYILYGSILYIFGPIVIALLPLGATNRLAKSYAENVFIWNAWAVLYAGFGALLNAIQMGQIGQMLSQNDFLGALGNLEGSVLIGLASIIYSLAIAVIPFIAKRIVSGEVGSSAVALMGAAATALTAGIAATEGAVAGVAAGRASLPSAGVASGQGTTASSTMSASTARTLAGAPGNQPAPQQRLSAAGQNAPASPTASTANSASAARSSGASSVPDSSPSMAEEHAERMRVAAGKPPASKREAGAPATAQPTTTGATKAGQPTGEQRNTAPPQGTARGASRGSSSQRPSISPYRLSTWGAYHIARFAASSAVKGGHRASQAVGSAADAITHPTETAGRFGSAAGTVAGAVVNAAAGVGRAGSSVAHAVTHPGETGNAIRSGVQNAGTAVVSAAKHASTTARDAATRVGTEFSGSYEKKRDEQR
jgi:hypothetical protein